MGRKPMDTEVERELGRLAEAVENSKLDRAEMKALIEKVGDIATEVRQAVNALNQTVQSMTTQIVALNSEKCGQRLDAIEKKNEHYDRVLGTANTFVWKMARILALVALLGAAGAKIADYI
jgi:hypothetical protein